MRAGENVSKTSSINFKTCGTLVSEPPRAAQPVPTRKGLCCVTAERRCRSPRTCAAARSCAFARPAGDVPASASTASAALCWLGPVGRLGLLGGTFLGTPEPRASRDTSARGWHTALRYLGILWGSFFSLPFFGGWWWGGGRPDLLGTGVSNQNLSRALFKLRDTSRSGTIPQPLEATSFAFLVPWTPAEGLRPGAPGRRGRGDSSGSQ